MNNGTHIPKAIRVGSILTLIAALAAFAAREAGAQTPTAPTRLTIGEAARLAA